MMIVAIHQPNYLPWLGYFHKIARAEVFIFLDDVQFSKNSLTNRVRILGGDGSRWLTVPVSAHLGDRIDEVRPAREDWAARHVDTLGTFYRHAPFFGEIMPVLRDMLGAAATGTLAQINRRLVEGLARRLGLRCAFRASSEFETGQATGDDRLIRLVESVAPGGCYLSGRGGAGYQDPAKFAAAGLELRYTDFVHPAYEQPGTNFVAGLSIVDALFNIGWERTAALLAERRAA